MKLKPAMMVQAMPEASTASRTACLVMNTVPSMHGSFTAISGLLPYSDGTNRCTPAAFASSSSSSCSFKAAPVAMTQLGSWGKLLPRGDTGVPVSLAWLT